MPFRQNQSSLSTYNARDSVLELRAGRQTTQPPKEKGMNVFPRKWERAGKLLNESSHVKTSMLFAVMLH